MTCAEVLAGLDAYVDGELTVDTMTAIAAHCGACASCGVLARREREFRLLFRRLPREAAPPKLRTRIVGDVHRHRGTATPRAWLSAATVAATAALILAVFVPWPRRMPPLAAHLVDKHIAYTDIERPAELASSDPADIARWFEARASLHVTVPDYSPAGIRLVGGRIADAEAHKAAHLLYQKGHTLVSVFMLRSDGTSPSGRRIAYRGSEYVTAERKGYRTVAWTDAQTLFGLVSSIDWDALLACADRLRLERARPTRP